MRDDESFGGRREDLSKLTSLMSNASVKVICIGGETGIGKTAIANQLFEQIGPPRFQRKFRFLAFRPSAEQEVVDWWGGLEDLLVTAIAQRVLPTVTPKATRSELVRNIVGSVSKETTLLLLDNVETLNQEWLLGLVDSWLQNAGESLLMLTTATGLSVDSTMSGYRLHQLEGLTNTDTILKLLGEEMRLRFKQEHLLEAATALGGNPQRLLYLRWLDPVEKEKLDLLVAALKGGGEAPIKDLGR